KLFNAKQQNYLDAGKSCGVRAEKIESDRLDVTKHFGFIELHIEQGPGMWRRDERLAIVDLIAGRHQLKVSMTGDANNAGATSMQDRRDALAGAAEVIVALEKFIGEVSEQAVITVGRLDVSPNAINVIAQRVDFTIDFRAQYDEQLNSGNHCIEQIIQDISARRSLEVEIIKTESIPAQPMDSRLIDALRGPAKLPIVMSGALHDSSVIAKHLPTAMVFVPSRDGISHNPAEFSRAEDITAATKIIEKLVRRTTLAELNSLDESKFVGVCGPFFEHSPWIAARAWTTRPFASLDELHRQLLDVVSRSSVEEKLGLIRAHPDLVGRLAREGRLTSESTHEQKSAGLDSLSSDEIERFERFNGEYRERFGFPFVICARENRKDAILASFPIRLKNDRSAEIETALREIGKIAHLRLKDALWE
ncbi:MAG TPA: 2-oxo-4-hydroxy-4-carboxy-5-ureidoimidazoline decarboxylase, partial [Tepidisphaeraceae bacterium]|nr:2-oxo-4-hydroxy-4-carboxy-5-ureidoimidazoline decarboxylase [Tepidisphaeraceae bacterium]